MPSCQSAVCRNRMRATPFELRVYRGIASLGLRTDKTRDLDRQVLALRKFRRSGRGRPGATLVNLILRDCRAHPAVDAACEVRLPGRGRRPRPAVGAPRRQASRARRRLAARPRAPVDGVLCSTATRTRETLRNTRIAAPVRYSERLYASTPGTLIDEINTVDDGIGTLLVIGHEPTMSALALGWAAPAAPTPLRPNAFRPSSRRRRSRSSRCRARGRNWNSGVRR